VSVLCRVSQLDSLVAVKGLRKPSSQMRMKKHEKVISETLFKCTKSTYSRLAVCLLFLTP